MVRFVVALLSLLVMTGCSTSMNNYQAGEKALYLFCTDNRVGAELMDAFLEQNLDDFKLAQAALEAIYREQYEAFGNAEDWPVEVRPEVEEYATLKLGELDNVSRVGAAVREATTFGEAIIAIGSTSKPTEDSVVNRMNELSTAIRVKLNLSLDRESSCVGY
jgi:hypothetical protein